MCFTGGENDIKITTFWYLQGRMGIIPLLSRADIIIYSPYT